MRCSREEAAIIRFVALVLCDVRTSAWTEGVSMNFRWSAQSIDRIRMKMKVEDSVNGDYRGRAIGNRRCEREDNNYTYLRYV